MNMVDQLSVSVLTFDEEQTSGRLNQDSGETRRDSAIKVLVGD